MVFVEPVGWWNLVGDIDCALTFRLESDVTLLFFIIFINLIIMIINVFKIA